MTTGVLLVGGASTRFGSAKALARIDGETLAARTWRLLGEAFDRRIAVGKVTDALPLPFDLVDDGTDVRAALAGIVAGLRATTDDVAVFLPVDMPFVRASSLQLLAASCRDAARTQAGPLPAALHRSTLPMFERRLETRALRVGDALAELDVAVVELDDAELVNVNTPADLGV